MRAEPWPIAIAVLLSGMITACLLFWTLAVKHADVELLPDGRPGLEAAGEPDGDR
jgi:hypothetical protein